MGNPAEFLAWSMSIIFLDDVCRLAMMNTSRLWGPLYLILQGPAPCIQESGGSKKSGIFI
jgi:hypothetical protein